MVSRTFAVSLASADVEFYIKWIGVGSDIGMIFYVRKL